MDFFRNHWFDIGGGLSLIVIAYVFSVHHQLSSYQILMWLSLIALFWHQLEEYRIVSTFPGMINATLFKSKQPDRYPLNPQTALYINVYGGWLIYLLAALFAERAMWLGLLSILISCGNIIAHCFIFNIKAKRYFNPGMASSILFFLPICIRYFQLLATKQPISTVECIVGAVLGIIANILIVKLIVWLANPNSKYSFSKRQISS